MSISIRPALLLVLLAATPAWAGISINSGNCDIHSDYSLSIQPTRLTFSKKDGTPASLVMANGTLVADGEPLTLGAADRDRVLGIERGVRDLEPEIKGIAREGIAIALDAVVEVNASFSSDPAEARATALRIQRSAAELDQYISTTDTISEVEVERFVGKTVSALIGGLVGNITAQAIKVAFSGDEKAAAELEARAEGIEKSVEKAAEKRSKALEQRAEALCPKFRALQKLERELEVRLADGTPLRLTRDGD